MEADGCLYFVCCLSITDDDDDVPAKQDDGGREDGSWQLILPHKLSFCGTPIMTKPFLMMNLFVDVLNTNRGLEGRNFGSEQRKLLRHFGFD